MSLNNVSTRTPEQLAEYFETGDVPTQEQFAELIKSSANVKQSASGTEIDNLGNTNKILDEASVEDNLTSTETKKPLSANQGKVVKDLLDATITSLGDYVKRDGSAELTANWVAGAFRITIKNITLTQTVGNPPLTVTSTTKVANLNADKLDDADIDLDTSLAADSDLRIPSQRAVKTYIDSSIPSTSDFLNKDGSVELTADWDAGNFQITMSRMTSTTSTGIAPLVVASTTMVANLNADKVDGADLDTDETLAADSDTKVPSQKAVKAYVDAATSTGVSAGELKVDIPSGAWILPSTDYAELDKDTGIYTSSGIYRHLFDDTTEEFVEAVIQLPHSDLTGKTAYIEVYGYASTWVTGKNIKLKLYHSAQKDDENWDQLYASLESSDLALNTTGQDYLDLLTFSETIANLDWESDDQVKIKLSRINADSNDLSGDWGMTHFRIRFDD
jgi:hypothetical protein